MTVVARMVASLEAETSSFHARMTAAEGQITKWSSSTASGARATRVLNSALQQLSFQAAGIPGPLGKAASAIGVLGIGGGPVMIAVAALGALALVFDRAGKSAEEFVEQANRVRDFELGHLKMLGGLAPEAKLSPAEQLANLEAKRANTLLAIQRLTPASFGLYKQTFDTEASSPGGFQTDPTAAARNATQRIAVLRGEVSQFDKAIAELAASIAEAERVAKLADIMFQQGVIALERGGVFQALRSGFNAPAFGSSATPQPSGAPTFSNIRRNQPRFVAGEPTPRAGLPPEFYAMAGLALVQGAQGGPGAFLQGAAGAAAMINPLAGVITGTLGTLFSMFEGKESERELAEERRHKELIGVLHEGPMRVTVISADDPEADLYAIRHQERLGGEPRLGGL